MRPTAVPESPRTAELRSHRVSSLFPCSERTGVAAYLRDAVGMLLASRTHEPLEFMDGYFQSVLRGDNVLMRNFAYVNATTRNRLSFIVAMQETFGDCEWLEPIAPLDYLELLRQLCPDFPRPLVSAAAAAVLPLLLPHSEGRDEGNAPPRVSFETLSLACNLWFFFAGTCPSHRSARIHATIYVRVHRRLRRRHHHHVHSAAAANSKHGLTRPSLRSSFSPWQNFWTSLGSHLSGHQQHWKPLQAAQTGRARARLT